MNRLNIQEPSPTPAGSAAVPLIKLDRTGFDYVILAAAYLFTPIGLVLALLRLMLTHYKNHRRPTNLNLIMHVFIGGFVELSCCNVCGYHEWKHWNFRIINDPDFPCSYIFDSGTYSCECDSKS